MAADTFTYTPSYGAITATRTPRILSARFGDGYEQRAVDGINAIGTTWELQFNNNADSIAELIDTFFKNQGGYKWFWWTPSGESTPKKFVCRKWDKTRSGRAVTTIKATFEEVFDFGT